MKQKSDIFTNLPANTGINMFQISDAFASYLRKDEEQSSTSFQAKELTEKQKNLV